MIKEKALQLLNELGSDPDQVAKSLEELGCKGNISEDKSCPIANYLKSKFDSSISVGAWEIAVGDNLFDAPKPVEEFIDQFDDSFYPNLIEENDE